MFKKLFIYCVIISSLIQAKEILPGQQWTNPSAPVHYGATNKNIFIEYEQWKNTERAIQLSDEYRTYITPEQLGEIEKRLWIRYQEENMRHYIKMNEVQEYNSSRPDMIYIENNQYYRRRPVPYYW